MSCSKRILPFKQDYKAGTLRRWTERIERSSKASQKPNYLFQIPAEISKASLISLQLEAWDKLNSSYKSDLQQEIKLPANGPRFRREIQSQG